MQRGNSGAPEQVRIVRRVAHQAAGLDKLTVWVHRWQSVLCREVQHLALLSADKWIWGRDERLGAVLFRSCKCALKIVNASHLKRLKFLPLGEIGAILDWVKLTARDLVVSVLKLFGLF
jgi:hypothetical protein